MTTILIVEDNALIAMAMAESLERAGHRVVGPAASNGPALEAARAAAPDLALVDVDLAGGDCGFDLALTLREELGVPSLFVTGQLGEACAHGSGALGALGKPFRISVLLDAVGRALEYAHGGAVPESGRQLRWFGAG